jgi:molybdenum cofactor synthesis domain-containing protein
MEYRLLEKTELWVSPLLLDGADLEACARAAARALDLDPGEIMVTDALDNRLTLDVLVPTIRDDQIVARKTALLEALRGVPGVLVTGKTEVHSDGILGLITLDEETGKEVLTRSRAMGAAISGRIQKRCMVFATGREVREGQIRDTNTPFLKEALRGEGYEVAEAQPMEDDTLKIARAFSRAAEEGFGLVISTGGIGAEGKDQTLEALERLDPEASLPYILKFRKGEGRHHKDGVRIGVGVLEQTLLVCLPGPHDEVRLVWPVLKEGLLTGLDKETLARTLASALRMKFLARSRDMNGSSKHKQREVEHGIK